MTIAQHSSKTNNHGTRADVVERARRLLGAIDLDPASSPVFNETVKAAHIWTESDDGLVRAWWGSVFLNPPGGKLRWFPNDSGEGGDAGAWRPVPKNENGRYMGPGESSMRIWWNRLTREYSSGRVAQAFFIGFTLEILRTSQSCHAPVQAFPRCYPRDRMAFGGDAPTHANVLVYLPPPELDADEALGRLAREFGDLGLCERGAR